VATGAHVNPSENGRIISAEYGGEALGRKRSDETRCGGNESGPHSRHSRARVGAQTAEQAGPGGTAAPRKLPPMHVAMVVMEGAVFSPLCSPQQGSHRRYRRTLPAAPPRGARQSLVDGALVTDAGMVGRNLVLPHPALCRLVRKLVRGDG